MSNEILVPVDGSEHSFKALGIAASLARARDLEVSVLHVIPGGTMPKGLAQWARAEHMNDPPAYLYDQSVAQNVMSAAQTHAHEAGLETINCLEVEHGDPAMKIIEAMGRRRPEMVVMASRGLSDLQGLIMGSVAHKVTANSTCTVVTVT